MKKLPVLTIEQTFKRDFEQLRAFYFDTLWDKCSKDKQRDIKRQIFDRIRVMVIGNCPIIFNFQDTILNDDKGNKLFGSDEINYLFDRKYTSNRHIQTYTHLKQNIKYLIKTLREAIKDFRQCRKDFIKMLDKTFSPSINGGSVDTFPVMLVVNNYGITFFTNIEARRGINI